MKRTGWLVVAMMLAACGQKPANSDAPSAPRIVSVGSAVTEIVYGLGVGGDVVGVDTSSLYPDATLKVQKVGYQRTLAAEGILSLRPTLVLASGEAGPPAVLEQLRSAGVRVEIFGADASLDAVRTRIKAVAGVLGKDPGRLLGELDTELQAAANEAATVKEHPRVLALYARGANSVYVFGEHTTTATMIHLAGAENAARGFDGTKPVSAEAIVDAAPDIILVPSRGLDSLGGIDAVLRIPGMLNTPAGKAKRVVAMDDLLLLGFGPRTGRAASELGAKLHVAAR